MSTRSTWLNRRQIDGGIDTVALPDSVPGRLWLCGKHAIAPDRQRLIDEVGGAATVVCLVERHELADRYPTYVEWLESADPGVAVWFPIPDLHAPDADRMGALVTDLVARLAAGETLVVHCGAGMGRAGTTAACVLIGLGVDADEAVRTIAAARPGAGPEVGAQRQLVMALAPSATQAPTGDGDG